MSINVLIGGKPSLVNLSCSLYQLYIGN